MRTVTVDLAELVDTYGMGSDQVEFFLDLETGEIITITDDMRFELGQVVRASEVAGQVDRPLTEIVRQADVPDDERDILLEIAQVDELFGERYVRIPHAESHDDYRAMEEFIETVSNARLRERLWRALDGRGAFRRFKTALLDDPQEWERWFAFQADRHRERVLEWLADEEIEVEAG